ncbi:unnamed protein product [Ceutorhynchus assimilis]|uniref:DUF4371 domain-containing protein n=1 Tax=Ceutorhynchus assimilis TaxID=467358 RepID=A0A9N9QMA6_9CUCU|nr:unnamed protein product [Ceutorhynchus assimilis]
MGDSVLDKSYVSLQKIRSYIVKLNYERRKTPIFDQKLNEAKAIYLEVKREVSSINQKIDNSELDDSEIRLVNELLVKINKLYDEILNFKDKQTEAAEMASFDLKVAVSLLPIMDDTENTTQKLIDAIELYDSMLNNEGKPLLIKFVLKTRLSNSAKLRLSTSYNSVNDLLGDIKKHFLTIKSDSALQLKLFRSKQGDKSIESFGKDLEELFVNLTISQAKGDENAYNVLKPINERAQCARNSNANIQEAEETTNVWPDQPDIVEILKKPENSIELMPASEKGQNSQQNDHDEEAKNNVVTPNPILNLSSENNFNSYDNPSIIEELGAEEMPRQRPNTSDTISLFSTDPGIYLTVAFTEEIRELWIRKGPEASPNKNYDFSEASRSYKESSGKGRTSYLSANICNEFIDIMAKQVLLRIVCELKAAKYFLISIDSTPDLSHIDQLTFIVRYVRNASPIERFLQCIPITKRTAQYLTDTVLAALKDLDIPIKDYRGQSYDNSNSNSYSKMLYYNSIQFNLLIPFLIT